MIKEHDCIVLTQNLPDEGLRAGDVGTVVNVHEGGAAYQVEFVTLTGQTVAVATVQASQLRPVNRPRPFPRARTSCQVKHRILAANKRDPDAARRSGSGEIDRLVYELYGLTPSGNQAGGEEQPEVLAMPGISYS